MGQSEFDMTISANMAMALLQLANRHADSIDYEVTAPPVWICRSSMICRSIRPAHFRSIP